MIEGSMQHDHPLTLQLLLERMRRLHAVGEVVAVRDGDRTRASFAEVAERADRLAGAPSELGVGSCERVATFAWNTQQHMEAYLAVPCMGAVLHTLNVRLFPDQLAYVVDHAEDIAALIEEEVRAGAYDPPVEPCTLAYAIVRLAEAFIYNDALAGIRGDVDALREIEAALLGLPPGVRGLTLPPGGGV